MYAPPPDLLTIDLGSLYPELKGKRLRGRVEGKKVVPYYNRAELETGSALRGHEIVWVDNALDAFLLQVQGSGRVQLTTGETIRLQYADQNGYPYQSIGRYLVDKGELPMDQSTLPAIRQWLASNPARKDEVLNANPSYVFFTEEKLEDPGQGPKGAQGVPLTAGRSIAVDPASVPLGAPVFLDTTFPSTDRPLQRLVVAQDTGGAIRGVVRADFFWGPGAAAGEQGGRMRQNLRMWMLWPKGAKLPPDWLEIRVRRHNQPNNSSKQHTVLKRKAKQLRLIARRHTSSRRRNRNTLQADHLPHHPRRSSWKQP